MKPRISISLADISFRLEGKKSIYSWIKKVAATEKKQASELSIVLCSDRFLLDMNKQFLNHNYYTDIITFDYSDGNRISGELYISVDRVKDNAKLLGVEVKHELYRVIIHGVLHLCGYGDKTEGEQKRMRRKEDEKLKMLDF